MAGRDRLVGERPSVRQVRRGPWSTLAAINQFEWRRSDRRLMGEWRGPDLVARQSRPADHRSLSLFFQPGLQCQFVSLGCDLTAISLGHLSIIVTHPLRPQRQTATQAGPLLEHLPTALRRIPSGRSMPFNVSWARIITLFPAAISPAVQRADFFLGRSLPGSGLCLRTGREVFKVRRQEHTDGSGSTQHLTHVKHQHGNESEPRGRPFLSRS